MAARRLNYNPALGTSFRMNIPGAGFEELNYFVQTTELPGLSMSGVDAPFMNNATNMPSNRIEYDPLNLTLIVDEFYKNVDSIRLWMHRICSTEPVAKEMRDITLHLLNSNKNSIIGVKFYGAYPTMVAAVPLETSTGDAIPPTCALTFRYQFYDFVRPE